jgi:hypothetical protein
VLCGANNRAALGRRTRNINTMLPVASYVLLALQALGVVAGVYTFVHAVRQRSDAFTAVDKLTKGKWIAIIVAATLLMAWQGPISFIGIFGVVAVGVYLADVRPKVDEIQRGPRW